MLVRSITADIRNRLTSSHKIIVLYGPRQVGKTTLVQQLLADVPGRKLSINADELRYIDVLSSRNLEQMKLLVDGYDLLFIDEAQRIPDVGINLKILHDGLPNLKLIVTGSSSFELANQTKEPLTGRTWTYTLYPIATTELRAQYNSFELRQLLDHQLIFGAYPELFSLPNQRDKAAYLQELSASYLYRDILALANLRYPDKLRKLLQLLAFQVGSEVSLNELSNTLQISRDTVATYIDLLEKTFVIFRLSGFSRNLRKEIVKMDKIYFYDLGIRNVLINNLNPLNLRNDMGALWENFLVVERFKRNAYGGAFVNPYFWRTYTGAELDYVEESGGQLAGFEFKYTQAIGKPPKTWLDTYPNATFTGINRNNYLDFVLL
ncbi:MAG: ATP-binding protein [Spirosoma sp.]|nr:ATP-binding protein [Spirosoma sp.]